MLMIDYMARPVIHEAFFKKYAGKKFLKGMLCSRRRRYAQVSDWTCSIHPHPPVVKEECAPVRHHRHPPVPR